MSMGAWWGRQGAGVTVRRTLTVPCPRSFTICHKTEVVKNTLNPVWQPFTIPVRALCNGDYDRYRDREWGSAVGMVIGVAMGPEHLLHGFGPAAAGSSELGPCCFFFSLFCNPNYIKASPSFPGPLP